MSRIALAGYALCAAASMVLGAVYILRSEFMPYHSQAVGADWASLPDGTRALIAALMNVLGAAWAVVGVLVLALVAIAYRTGNTLARWAVPAGLAILYGSILIVTLRVEHATGADTLWMMNAFALAVAGASWLVDAPWRGR
jgi:hypothetical protein